MAERTFTSRGFGVYAELTDSYGNTVKVQESSNAEIDAVWIFASHGTPKLRPEWRQRLAAAGFATERQLGELAAFLIPAPHLNVEQPIKVRDALDEFISEHQEATGVQ